MEIPNSQSVWLSRRLRQNRRRPPTGTPWALLILEPVTTPDAITALERSVTLTGGGTGFDFAFLTLAHARLGQNEQANHWKAQTDLWMEQHEIHHPELSRLHVQAGASLTFNACVIVLLR